MNFRLLNLDMKSPWLGPWLISNNLYPAYYAPATLANLLVSENDKLVFALGPLH